MSHRLKLLAEQIDTALQAAYALATNAGVPVADGKHALAFQRLEQSLSGRADRLPSSAAVDAAIRSAASLAKILRLRGIVESEDALPQSANNGDTYIVSGEGKAYVWDGEWKPCGNIAFGVGAVNGISPDQTGAVTIGAESIKTLSGENVEEAIARKQDALSAGDGIGIQGGSVYVKALPCNPNLLDNYNFGDPVNQRGASGTISTPGYFFDRWKLESGSVTIENGYIVLDGAICQLWPYNPQYPYNAPTVATVLTENGIDDVIPEYTAENNVRKFRITAAGEKIYCAKLEIGHEQTLAHNSNGKWYPNERTKYVETLMQCKRFLTAFDNNSMGVVGMGYRIDSSTIWGYFQMPFKMYGTPTLSDTSGKNWAIRGGGKYYTPSKAEYVAKRDNCFVLKFTVNGAVENTPFIITCVSESRILLSCEP